MFSKTSGRGEISKPLYSIDKINCEGTEIHRIKSIWVIPHDLRQSSYWILFEFSSMIFYFTHFDTRWYNNLQVCISVICRTVTAGRCMNSSCFVLPVTCTAAHTLINTYKGVIEDLTKIKLMWNEYQEL